jgi:hypothetical protein
MDTGEAITRGTGNLLADLDYPDAEARKTRLRLTHAVDALIQRRRPTQAATEPTGSTPRRLTARDDEHRGLGAGGHG